MISVKTSCGSATLFLLNMTNDDLTTYFYTCFSIILCTLDCIAQVVKEEVYFFFNFAHRVCVPQLFYLCRFHVAAVSFTFLYMFRVYLHNIQYSVPYFCIIFCRFYSIISSLISHFLDSLEMKPFLPMSLVFPFICFAQLSLSRFNVVAAEQFSTLKPTIANLLLFELQMFVRTTFHTFSSGQ